MKKLMILTSLFLYAGLAWGQTKQSAQVDLEAEKAAINAILDKFDEEMKKGDAAFFYSALADEALICGTDPSEFWTRSEYLGLRDQQSDFALPEFNYIGDRVIKVAPGGNSAIVVTQFVIEWSPKIPWRTVYHFIKTDGQWKVFFVNIAFVPRNEVIGKINEAIE